jgi:L-aminopeptidase/D-esterase-like protein
VTGWERGRRDAITDVNGIRVGHWSDRRAGTGCTVILCEEATGAAVDVRGGAPGTRETDVLNPANIVRRCHAVVLSGGSAFGLAAATGVMRWCREHDIGFETTAGRVPIVSSAVIFDLAVGKADRWPGEAEGYAAAAGAKGGAVAQGSVGAGTGATVAKMLGNDGRLKGGVGTASLLGPDGLVVGALVVTNAVGSIVDPESGELLAGPRIDGQVLALPEVIRRRREQMDALAKPETIENTTLVCVATNAQLDHHTLQRVAYQAHDGLARTIVPCHTFGDGDVAFAVAMGKREAAAEDPILVGILATAAVERAVLKSVRAARALAGVAAIRDSLSARDNKFA